jgi:hypothetical protein
MHYNSSCAEIDALQTFQQKSKKNRTGHLAFPVVAFPVVAATTTSCNTANKSPLYAINMLILKEQLTIPEACNFPQDKQ